LNGVGCEVIVGRRGGIVILSNVLFGVQEFGEDKGHVYFTRGVVVWMGLMRGERALGLVVARGGLGAAVLAAAAADGDVAERAAFGPVASAGFAEIAGLRQAVVVVVTEFGVAGSATRTIGRDLDVGFPPRTLFHWGGKVMMQHALKGSRGNKGMWEHLFGRGVI